MLDHFLHYMNHMHLKFAIAHIPPFNILHGYLLVPDVVTKSADLKDVPYDMLHHPEKKLGQHTLPPPKPMAKSASYAHWAVRWVMVWYLRVVIEVICGAMNKAFYWLGGYHWGTQYTTVTYGHHPREKMHYIQPTRKPKNPGPGQQYTPIVYLHGGGFFIVGKSLSRTYASFFTREGYYPMFNVDYPQIPEYPFPAPLLSVMKALETIKRDYGVEEIILCGDSAGSTLAVMAVLLLQHAPLRLLFNKEIINERENTQKPDCRDPLILPAEDYPKIKLVGSFFGLHESDRFEEIEKGTGSFYYLLRRWLNRQVIECYANRRQDQLDILKSNSMPYFPPGSVWFGNCFAFDWADWIDRNFPTTLVLCGTADMLYPTNCRFAALLKANQVPCRVAIFPAEPHGFICVPFRRVLNVAKQQVFTWLRDYDNDRPQGQISMHDVNTK